tara:strand:- start:79 stop:477 length:399 start_codon:yes stop_codon:yes gene_type:complete
MKAFIDDLIKRRFYYSLSALSLIIVMFYPVYRQGDPNPQFVYTIQTLREFFWTFISFSILIYAYAWFLMIAIALLLEILRKTNLFKDTGVKNLDGLTQLQKDMINYRQEDNLFRLIYFSVILTLLLVYLITS